MGKTKKETNKSVSSNAGQARSRRILLADDNKAIRNVVSEFLEFIGYEVALAINGIEALAVFLDRTFDLVLTDFEMPAMDGLTLAGHIKERSPRTPVILLTGSDSEAVLEKVKRGSVDSVIFKPFRLEDLQSTVQGALASRERGPGSVGPGEASGRFSEDQKSLSGF
ncbi:MAG: response regulator [Desulfobacterales bacterium]|nr:response regulator [Desulfobacterales bacterium]